jgi:hypothetical protein
MSVFVKVGEAERTSGTSLRRFRLMPMLVSDRHEALRYSYSNPRDRHILRQTVSWSIAAPAPSNSGRKH